MKELFIKFINRECTEEEVQQIIAYFNSSNDLVDVPTIEAVSKLLDTYPDMEADDAERIYKNIQTLAKEQNNKPTKKKNFIWHYTAAAIFIGVIGISYLFKSHFINSDIKNTTPIIVNTTNIIPGTDKATLTLEDGSQVALEGVSFQTQNANSNGEEIIYKETKQNTKEIVYNYLTIPRGGQFFIKLSDGTQIWLNSESQLKYPVHFIDGETRQVELVYGEAYFDVSPSTEHNGAKFKVINQTQEVEVLGTEFNIKAYKDESNVYTTLVEGKVIVGNGIVKQNLVPNQQSKLDSKTNKITITKVDVKEEISWKDGVFRFVDKPLISIMKVISRWYDVDIVFENKDLESVEFIGTIDKHQSIDEILSIMKSSSINSYEIKNDTIILK